jgi:hypothetical protein
MLRIGNLRANLANTQDNLLKNVEQGKFNSANSASLNMLQTLSLTLFCNWKNNISALC